MFYRNILIITVAVSIFSGCGKKDIQTENGIFKFVSGDVSIFSGNLKNKAKTGDMVKVGERIVTGADGVAVIEIANGLAMAEIQNNADFKVATLSGNSSEFQADNGNIWLNVMKKLTKGETVSLKTKTTVASVRGTKFYTFAFDEYQGTCYCEGEVSLKGIKSSFSNEMKKDYVSYTKNGTTIFLSPKETEFMVANGHNHSILDKSPLGPKACSIDPEMMKKLKSIIEKKFAAAK